MSKYFKFGQTSIPEEISDGVDMLVELRMDAKEEEDVRKTVCKQILGRPLEELMQELEELGDRYPKDVKIAMRLDNFLHDDKSLTCSMALVTSMLSELPESLGNAMMEKIVLEIRSNYELRRERARREAAKEMENGEASNGTKGEASVGSKKETEN